MPERFVDKVVIVTGACGGIGREAVRLFALEGAAVVLADLAGAQLRETANELGLEEGRYLLEAADVSNEDAVEKLVDNAVSTFGQLDVMCNNAGIIGEVAKVEAFPTESMRRVIDVNVMGAFYGTKHALRVMLKQQKGVIIMTSSIAGFRGMPDTVAYVASKHAVMGIARTAAVENARRGIRVCAVCPAPVDTPMMSRIAEGMVALGLESREQIESKLVSPIPMGRYAIPEEVAKTIVFLASGDASFISGTPIFVDGCFMA